MPCGVGSPIASLLGAADTASQIVLSTNPDLGEVRLQLHRIINYMTGEFDETIGGMRYEEPKNARLGLGRSILRDLDRFRKKELRKNERPEYPLKAENAEAAWQLANAALVLAREGLAEAESEGDFKRIHKTTRIVSRLLKDAMEIVLA